MTMMGSYSQSARSSLPALTQVRYGATLKTVKNRMRSVDNIKKITSAMKMVSAAKLKHDMRRLENGTPFSAPVQKLFDRIPRDENSTAPVTLFVMTSDKGLCGAANSAPAKHARLTLVDEEARQRQVSIQILGNKGPAALGRLFGTRFTQTFDELLKNPWNFGTACVIGDRINASNPDSMKLISNSYKSMIAFDTDINHFHTKTEVSKIEKGEWSKAIDPFSFEPGMTIIWDDLHEFYYACTIFGKYLDALAAEQSSRMNAMENASKNAGELLENLSLIYNRTRQAKITTELCEIISGASAV